VSVVDIILPTYNQANFIDFCIPSILNQNFKDFSLIIINDGSTDSTEDRVKKYLSDERVVYMHHENCGLPRSLNVGHNYGSGDYCTWISTDNISRSNHVDTLLNYIIANGCDFVHSNFIKIKGKKKTEVDMKKKKGRLGLGNLGPSFLYKRCVWEKYKYDEDCHGAEDIKFYAQVVLSDFVNCHLSEPLVEYYCQENSISQRMGNAKINKVVDRVRRDLRL
tara:strand:+ start:70 stop:732 length:663 start_codon:yes stop_codon:yes gene_type:complete